MGFSGAILYVPDVRKTLAFYEKAFGLGTRFVTDGGEYGDLDTGSLILGFASIEQSKRNWEGGVQATDPAAPPVAFEVGIESDDVPGAFEAAVAAGAAVLKAPEEKPWGQMVAFVRDLDGHVVEISSPWAP